VGPFYALISSRQEIGPPVQVVVGAPGDYDAPLGRRDRGAHASDRLVEVADGPGGISGRVLDADTRQPVLDRGLHCCRDVLGGISVAVLEVAVDRQASQPGEQPRVREVLVSGDLVSPVQPTQRRGERQKFSEGIPP